MFLTMNQWLNCGMKQGDIILGIDGENMDGATLEFKVAKFKEEVGDTENILVQQISNVNSDVSVLTKKLFFIQREYTKINPDFKSTLLSSMSPNDSADSGTTYNYNKL